MVESPRDAAQSLSPGAADEDAAFVMAPLAVPFAAFGAAAGLFAVLGAGGFRNAARDVSPLVAMIVTALAGAAAGILLRAWPRLRDPLLPRDAVVLSVGGLVAAAGGVSGGAVGGITWGPDGIARFALGGISAGVLFTPSALVVFDAARRAGRGRHGSLVAGTDRRTVLSTVLAGVAFAGAMQVPAILTMQASVHITPLAQGALPVLACFAATAGIAQLQRRDRAARAALDAFAKEAPWLDRVEAHEGGDAGSSGGVDLGLGEGAWARTSDRNYRASGKADVLVKGSVEAATAAFEEGARRRHRAMVVAACGLTAVTVALALRLPELP